MTQNATDDTDAYYGDEEVSDEELDLSFLDEEKESDSSAPAGDTKENKT